MSQRFLFWSIQFIIHDLIFSDWIKIVTIDAFECIQQMVKDLRHHHTEKKQTLAYWLVAANLDILHALQDFAKSNRIKDCILYRSGLKSIHKIE